MVHGSFHLQNDQNVHSMRQSKAENASQAERAKHREIANIITASDGSNEQARISGRQELTLQNEISQPPPFINGNAASLYNTFKVSSKVKPKTFKISKRIQSLVKPKTLNVRKPHPFMHAEFRGLLHADHQDAVQACFSTQNDTQSAFS